MPAPVTDYPTPVLSQIPRAGGLTFPSSGTGLPFDAGYPLTFPPGAPQDLARLFPTIMPEPERAIYQTVKDACSTRTIFPDDAQGLELPAVFSIPPDVSLYAGLDDSYPPWVDQQGQARQVTPIPVVRGWPAYPGQVPAIGVAEATSTDDPSGRTTQGGFAGDVYAVDSLGNALATCAYYAEPLHSTVVVELIHTNRDERDRLHDQLRRVIFPLRHLIGAASPQVRDVQVNAEKQDLPVDEQPIVMYVSLFTVEVEAEALIPTEIVIDGVIERIDVTVTETQIPLSTNNVPDLT